MTSTRGVSPDKNCIVQLVIADHRQRANIAMAVAERGGHAETYEDIAELVTAKPKVGTAVVSQDMGSAAQILAQFQAAGIILPLTVFGENPQASQIVKAIHEGAANYLVWPFTAEDLFESCAYCQAFMEQEGGRIARERQARMLVDGLSGRERQILAFMLEGHSNKSMAQTLHLSPRTIEDYRLSAMKKLGVEAASAAIRLGLEAGLHVQHMPTASEGTAVSLPLT